jgi:hypothetical protein
MALNEFPNIAANGNYPSDDGIRLGLKSASNASLLPITLMHVDLIVAGTPGSGASYQVEVLERDGQWVPVDGLLLEAAGQVSGYAEGNSVRLVADNGSGAGTGANTPRYYLNTNKIDEPNVGEYAG